MNFLQRLKDGAGKVTDRAQNVVEIGKLNTQISNIERELGLYYQKMGEIFYEGYRKKDMSYAEKEMLDLAKTCDLLAEERDEIRAKVAELKNERLCGACGRTVSEDAVFCQYCGHKLVKRKKAVIPEDLIEPVRAAAPTAEDTRIAASPEPPGKETKRTIDLEQLAVFGQFDRIRGEEGQRGGPRTGRSRRGGAAAPQSGTGTQTAGGA